jgi:hypothetical protein
MSIEGGASGGVARPNRVVSETLFMEIHCSSLGVVVRDLSSLMVDRAAPTAARKQPLGGADVGVPGGSTDISTPGTGLDSLDEDSGS